MEPQFDRIALPSLVDESHRQIKTRILSGELQPGSPLRDSVLARAMGVSRSPVREALRLLEQSGLVVKAANYSYRVAAVDAEDAAELAALRLADEGLAVRVIVRDRIAIDSLAPLLEDIRSAPVGTLDAASADAAFHTAVVALAGLRRLSARHADLADQTRLMLLSRDVPLSYDQEAVWRRHVELYEALAAAIGSGDPSEVLTAWEAHVTHAVVAASQVETQPAG